ncbi:cation diffusion facilitator family transporter [Lutimonas zeaxanthinifaciens]|uniref:cation diffusion facilitator family transporter n=1 Tax=Lutimonas zeaxanthinifaciens TaxID=3060215 RepID=UPI00265CE999|nr:cation diffusion facilitator family transporter [Lutimonas sp. YSD2104]WKK66020.1 cation diffusion facilitator family transporter [Lutimonas sp. YSD2104]
MGHQHSHSHGQLSGNRLLFSIVLNIIITISQIIGGIISGSLALISDAVHNLSDVISLIISYSANLLVNKKKQTLHQTFGFKRAEIIAAFINSSTLIVIAFFLAIEAVKRLNNPAEIESNLVIWLALIAILANGLSVLLLRKDADHNLNMRSAYLHLITDMLTSVAVFAGGLLMKYYEIYWLDAVLTIIISLYLFYMSWSIFIDSLKILMLFAPKGLEIQAIQDEITALPEIENIHHVHIWQLNDHDIHFEAHIEFEKDIKLSEFDEICSRVELILFEKFHINHSNLQPEYERDDHKDFIIQD